MRFLLMLAALFSSTTIAFGEDAYNGTRKLLGECIGQETRRIMGAGTRISPDAMDEQLQQKCGHLEKRVEKEFLDFVASHTNKTLTAETAYKISAYIVVPASRGREIVVKSYKCVTGVSKYDCPENQPAGR
ncbi:MAG TPA: hypothetical protein VKG24_08155 [Pseudolabrys sp.]|jgi:hypothetical protein|nr:hypothetical protein [Pseudolabrys sp.]